LPPAVAFLPFRKGFSFVRDCDRKNNMDLRKVHPVSILKKKYWGINENVN
jgi:hypothetical protein